MRMCMLPKGGSEWHFHSELRTAGWASGASHMKQRWIRLGGHVGGVSGYQQVEEHASGWASGVVRAEGVVCQAAAQHLVVHDVACLRMCKSQRRYHVVKTKRGARTDPQAREKRERSYARKKRCIVRKGDLKRIKKEETTTGTTNYVVPYRYFVPFRGPSGTGISLSKYFTTNKGTPKVQDG